MRELHFRPTDGTVEEVRKGSIENAWWHREHARWRRERGDITAAQYKRVQVAWGLRDKARAKEEKLRKT